MKTNGKAGKPVVSKTGYFTQARKETRVVPRGASIKEEFNRGASSRERTASNLLTSTTPVKAPVV